MAKKQANKTIANTKSSSVSKKPSSKTKITKTAPKTRATKKPPKPVASRKDKASKPKEHNYSSYHASTKEDDFAISRRPISARQSARHQARNARALRRRTAIVFTILLLLVAGVALAKFFMSNKIDDSIPVSDVDKAESIETPPKSELELQKEKAEQNFKNIGEILNNSTFSADSVAKLKIPIYRQTYRQSCESSALRMAFAYRGIEITDLDVMELMNYDDKPAEKVDSEWIWGNPHEMFVGYKDGDQTNMTGYGVFAEPIVAASEKLGRPAALKNEVKPEWLAQHIYAGNPVLLWGISIKISDVKWKTPTGEEITVPMRTHTRLVVGVRGDPLNPTGFYINDPANGTEIYWTTAQLVRNIEQGVDQAVAVF